VGHVALAQAFDYLAEDLVGFLGEGTAFEHIAVHLFEVHLDGVVKFVEVFHGDGDSIAIEHLEDFVPGESA
jgi:hypothetical protein